MNRGTGTIFNFWPSFISALLEAGDYNSFYIFVLHNVLTSIEVVCHIIHT